jgi:hypothetical protein
MNTAPHDDATCKALALANHAIDQWEDERDKTHALATVLVSALAPVDANDTDDNDRLIEWRIAQVIEEMLGCTASVSETRHNLRGMTK